MTDPVYPNEVCVRTLRATVARLLQEQPTPQSLGEHIIEALHFIEDAGAKGEWREVAAAAGTIASMALVLQIDAMSRMAPRAKA